MTEENFHQVIDHFLVMRICLEPQACLLAATVGTAEQKAHLNTLMAEMAALKENFRRERWIEVDMAWHEHIYEMSANPFLTSFASLFHSVYHTYFTSITSDTVIKLICTRRLSMRLSKAMATRHLKLVRRCYAHLISDNPITGH